MEQISELLVRSRHNESKDSPELRGVEQSAIMIYEESAASSFVHGEGGKTGPWTLGLRADDWPAPRIETHYSSQPDSFLIPTGMVRCVVDGFDALHCLGGLAVPIDGCYWCYSTGINRRKFSIALSTYVQSPSCMFILLFVLSRYLDRV